MEEHPGQVDRQDRVPLRQGHVGDRLVDDPRGVVDQDVQLAEPLHRQLDDPLRRLLPGDVPDEGHDPPVAGQVLHGRLDVLGDDRRAPRLEQECGGPFRSRPRPR